MARIAKERALEIAAQHAGGVPLGHPDYRMSAELTGAVDDEWLFAYRVKCLKDIPPMEQEQFAGPGGFLVGVRGQVRELSVPMFMEAAKKVEAR